MFRLGDSESGYTLVEEPCDPLSGQSQGVISPCHDWLE